MSTRDKHITSRVILSDYGSKKELGVVTIDYKDDSKKLLHHWIKFPDGQVRRDYNYREVKGCVAEEMEAFEMVPRLKVGFRPVSAALQDYTENVFLFCCMFLCALVIDGAVMLICHQLIGQGAIDVLYNSRMGVFIQDILWWGFGVSSILSLICVFASRRYDDYTPDDRIPREWARKQHAKLMVEHPDDGW